MIHDFPWTDMHELNLDWFLAEFKKLVEEWNQVQNEWTSLHDYVQNYFDNLNVQTEIDNKINAMISDGSFATIVTPLVEATLPTIVDGKLPAVVASQISAVVAAQIGAVVAGQLPAVAAQAAADEVGDWLAAHIDPDTGYVIDDSLTVSQAAADSKTVGNYVSAITNNILVKTEDKTDTGTASIVWDTNTGITASQISDLYIKITKAVNATATNGYMSVNVLYTDSTQTYNNITELNKWTKINYDPDKTFSAVYIAHRRSDSTLLDAVTSEWEYTLVNGKPINDRMSVNETDIATNNTNITNIFENTYFNQTWVRGAYYNGVYSNIPTNRICTEHIFTVPYDCNLTIDAGFRFEAQYFNPDDTYKSGSSWTTDSLKLKTGERVVIVIARVTEITETADIVGFMSKLYVYPDFINAESELYDYVKTGVENVVSDAINILKNANMAVCVFNTDQHITARDNSDRAMRGLKGIEYMSTILPLNSIVLGGDAVGYSSTTVDDILKDDIAVQTPIEKSRCKIIPNPGNHDANQNNNSITEYEMYSVNFRNPVSLNMLTDMGNTTCNGYYDDDSVKIRFIFVQTDLSTGYDYNDAALYSWIDDCLTTMPAGYKAVFFGHHALTSEYNDTLTQGRAFQSILNPHASDIICVISGHSHKDVSIVSTAGILYIETTCAWNQISSSPDGTSYTDEDGKTRTNGTVSETSYDVFLINPTTKDVYAVRYGTGSSRTWLIADRIPETDGLTT